METVEMSSSAKGSRQTTWGEAVARLKRERTLAETAAQELKGHGDAAAVRHGALAYGEAKAEYDGVISGLMIAVASGSQPAYLADLEARLERGLRKRETFCRSVKGLVSAEDKEKKKGLVEDVIKAAIGPLINAVKAIVLRIGDDKANLRETIKTQLRTAI